MPRALSSGERSSPPAAEPTGASGSTAGPGREQHQRGENSPKKQNPHTAPRPPCASAGSIVAITLTVIATVVLVFGAAAYLKMRHSSYGRLRDSHDYGSWGSYNNPLYDDS
uniref:Prostate androgen-regulated mucin-like protein 1 n=1 Tax=Nothoprocta perdicaria TaxID=30464 RepID=A0A8C7A4J5_NOTPE